jgi:hypothetical protein
MSNSYRKYFGKKFYKTPDGYWQNMMPIHAHRWVWINHFGAIPQGMDIHHKDGDKSNNEIENLEMLSRSDHLKRHWQEGRFDLDQRRIQLAEARKWLSIPQGRKKQSEDAKEGWKNRKQVAYQCKGCNKDKFTYQKKSDFCSDACRSRWKRQNKPNPIEIICLVCKDPFIKDKSDKKLICSRNCSGKMART